MLAADSRTSSGTYVANRVQDKISRLADNVYILRSGSASDTQAIASYVKHFISQQSSEEGQPGYIDVKRAATLAMQIAYGNKGMLSAGMIIAGWDEKVSGDTGACKRSVQQSREAIPSVIVYRFIRHACRC